MALRVLPSSASWRSVIPRAFPLSESLSAGRWPLFSLNSSVLSSSLLRPVAISLTIPGIFSDIWDSVLRAVPKKKVSHMKRRHRQMAGKALKDVKNLATCPGCGEIKRSHVLCPNCVSGMYSGYREWSRVGSDSSLLRQISKSSGRSRSRSDLYVADGNGKR